MQSGQHANLAREPLTAFRGAELGMENLEGDRAVVSQVASAVDGGHATAAELSLDRVATGECCVRVRDFVVHASRPEATGSPKIRAAGAQAPDRPCRPRCSSHNLLTWPIHRSSLSARGSPLGAERARSRLSRVARDRCR